MTLFGRRFRPRLGPSLAALIGVLVLLGLGTWQIQRLAWKEALIAQYQARASAPPIPLPNPVADPAALDNRPVRLVGRFLHDRELYLGARSYQGEVGFHIVTPVRLDDGRAVLVDRGWVPAARRDPATREAGQVAGTVEIAGVARSGGWRGSAFFRPANEPERNHWLWYDLPVMAARAGLENAVTTVYVAAAPGEVPGGLPIAVLPEANLRNEHLEYAITWYTLAVALAVIYFLHQSRPARGRKDGDE